MKHFLALVMVLLGFASANCADREEARIRLRDAPYQTIERQQVTERYRYYVPVSAFAQRRSDEPRAYAKWRAGAEPLASAPARAW
jgi:hypothetical protein